jgi:hypothetical protein
MITRDSDRYAGARGRKNYALFAPLRAVMAAAAVAAALRDFFFPAAPQSTCTAAPMMAPTWKGSAARMAWAWAWRNSGQEGPDRGVEGSMPATCRIFQMVGAPIW